jgi:hypothetical protein
MMDDELKEAAPMPENLSLQFIIHQFAFIISP